MFLPRARPVSSYASPRAVHNRLGLIPACCVCNMAVMVISALLAESYRVEQGLFPSLKSAQTAHGRPCSSIVNCDFILRLPSVRAASLPSESPIRPQSDGNRTPPRPLGLSIPACSPVHPLNSYLHALPLPTPSPLSSPPPTQPASPTRLNPIARISSPVYPFAFPSRLMRTAAAEVPMKIAKMGSANLLMLGLELTERRWGRGRGAMRVN